MLEELQHNEPTLIFILNKKKESRGPRAFLNRTS
jgi:hypothetical protein